MARGCTRGLSSRIVDLGMVLQRRHGDVLGKGVRAALAILEAMHATNKTMVCTFFHTHVVVPYREKVLERDEAFFMTPGIPFVFPEVVAPIQRLWVTLPEGEKEEMWGLVQALVRDVDEWVAEHRRERVRPQPRFTEQRHADPK